MLWRFRNSRSVELSRSGLIMGILNVTPDSFADGGQFLEKEAALRQAARLVSEGAAMLDVGGESSRPGSDPVPLEEELRRVVPVLTAIRSRFPRLIISIDTYKAETARQALAAGADIINDISALRSDPEMIDVVKNSDAGVILMHMRGTPKTMQIDPQYEDVVAEVSGFLSERLDSIVSAGVDPYRIAIDPGFGFGKRLRHNVSLIQQFDRFLALGRPIVVGVSRKSMIAQMLRDPKLQSDDRLWPTVALTSLLREKGARVFRVHDVRPNIEALRMTESILSDV
ncbi:MAG: dihydropteroate synthase [Verrucomicrobia bacterium]|nr:dihydropteroate synthase [Verrucomicrobiota bacterium]